MQRRRTARILAVQGLYMWEVGGRDDALARTLIEEGAADVVVRTDAAAMLDGAWQTREAADAAVARLAPQWPSHRQPGVDRAILRLAAWELWRTATPPRVVIDEAVEIAREFSTEHSHAFVNGVLDALLKEGPPASPDSNRNQHHGILLQDTGQAQGSPQENGPDPQHRREDAVHPQPPD